ncbi:hypothetical protein BLA18110_02889 [Burkholderia lata]|nr:hypothetical protein BLA18110_02889 [Burkholderia lata]
MMTHELERGGRDRGPHDVGHEARVPVRETFPRIAGERREHVAQVRMDVERAGRVTGRERGVDAGEFGRVDKAMLDHEMAPGLVAVERNEGEVEIEKRELRHRMKRRVNGNE